MVLLSMQKDGFWSLELVNQRSQYPVGLGQTFKFCEFLQMLVFKGQWKEGTPLISSPPINYKIRKGNVSPNI